MIRVPVNLSASTRLKCPLCQTRFRLSDVLQQDVPMAEVENIEEDDDSSVLPPMEESELRRNRNKTRSGGLKHPSSPRWKLQTTKAEANHSKGSTDGGLLSSTSKQVFAEDFPFSAKEKEQSQKEESERKERRSRFPKQRLSEKPISEQPFGKLKTSRRQPRDPSEAAENGHFPEGVDPLSFPLKSLHQPLPMKEKHTVLKKSSGQQDPALHTHQPVQTQQPSPATESTENNSQSSLAVSAPADSNHLRAIPGQEDYQNEQASKTNRKDANQNDQRFVMKTPVRRSEESRRAPWVDLVVMILCCLISLPMVQLGLWWVVKVDPLGIAPSVRNFAPLVVPSAEDLE